MILRLVLLLCRLFCSRRRFMAAFAALLGLISVALGEQQAERHVAWLADVQRAPKLRDDASRLAPLLVDRAGKPIATLDAWQERRDEVRQRWLKFLGMWQQERKPPKLEILSSETVGQVVRQLVRYPTEPGVKVEAYLIKPARLTGKVPGVAVFHSTVDHTIRQPAGLGSDLEKAWGLRLAERGMITLSPRNFLWTGDKPSDARARAAEFLRRRVGAKGMTKMLHDARVALDLLESLPDVDARRLGAAGHSLGAKEVLYLAAFDERVRAAVSSEGGVGIRFSNWNDLWYLGNEVDRPGFAMEHHELLALVAPRAFLLIGGDSADGARSWPFIEAALPVYRLYGEPAPLGLLNHGKGHSVPLDAERRVYQWLEAYLR